MRTLAVKRKPKGNQISELYKLQHCLYFMANNSVFTVGVRILVNINSATIDINSKAVSVRFIYKQTLLLYFPLYCVL